jgi:hypothetical protein
MQEPTHRAEIVFVRDGYRTRVVSYMWIRIGILVDPQAAAIETLEELAAERGTTLADCEKYSLCLIENVTPEQRAADARMSQAATQPPLPKPNPYR